MFGLSDELFAELDRSERLLGEIDELTKLKQQEVSTKKSPSQSVLSCRILYCEI